VAVHEEVLHAAVRLCAERGDWIFTVDEVVRALAHLNEHSVRTHVASRCCVNAPRHHLHRWPYFRRVARGRYEVLPKYRIALGGARAVAERRVAYGRQTLRDTIHAIVHRDPPFFVAECLEVPVVTQGRTADDVLSNLRQAITLHLEGEDVRSMGLTEDPRLVVTYELPLGRHGAES